MAVAQPEMFTEIIDFLASTPTPEHIIAFRPSDQLEQRLDDLMQKNRDDTISVEERQELDEFLRMNHFMNMLKIRARQKLTEA